MTSRNLVPTTEEDFLDVDTTIPGQNYVCISFVSPEEQLVQRELFYYNKFMTQACGEFEKSLDEVAKDFPEELNDRVVKDLRSKLYTNLRNDYNGFKSKFDDFKYKYKTELEAELNKASNFRTNVRGVKVRGVYNTYQEAEQRSKVLQRKDRSFHVFVGQIGFWLPWDPCADGIENEEYLEEELNTLMREYKENEIRRDLFYEDQKREAKQDAMRKKMEHDKKQKENETTATLEEKLTEEDPWMAAKFTEATEANAPEANAPEANAPEVNATEVNTNEVKVL